LRTASSTVSFGVFAGVSDGVTVGDGDGASVLCGDGAGLDGASDVVDSVGAAVAVSSATMTSLS
jgi:hypothetical protein